MINKFTSENIERIAEGLKSRNLTDEDIINIETVYPKLTNGATYFIIWYRS